MAKLVKGNILDWSTLNLVPELTVGVEDIDIGITLGTTELCFIQVMGYDLRMGY
jgi:hypothetical protein